MKIKFVLFLVFAVSASIILSSYRLGVTAYAGIDATGAEGTGMLANGGTGAVGCSTGVTCHNATTSLNTVLELDSLGVPVTSYRAGGSYTVKISAVNNTANNLPEFGFQLATVLASSAGTNNAVQAGTWDSTSLPARAAYVQGGASGSGLNIPVVEQDDTIPASSGTGGTGTIYTVSIPWTAPVAGTGSIKIYGAINAGTHVDLAPQAYYQLAPAITITEATTTGINQLSNVVNSFNAYPSLMNDQVTVAFDLKEASAASLTLVSMQGQTVKTLISQEPLSVGNVKRTFDVSGLAQGIYLLRLQIGAGSEVTKLVKQ